MPRVDTSLVVPLRSGHVDTYPLAREVYEFEEDCWYVRDAPYWQPARERYVKFCEDGTCQTLYPAGEIGAAILGRAVLLTSFVEAVRERDIGLAEDFSNFLGVE